MNFVLCRMSRLSLRTALRWSVSAGSLFASLSCVPAYADNIATVNKYMRAGQYAEALAHADGALAKRPRDEQLRFLKGVILAEQNKPAEAIAIFQKLTEDHPSLPEPYNNLAVLYAAAGQYDKARSALTAAIRTNPSYAVAYENLGDIHARLASQAYDKALQLERGNSDASSKLTMVRSLGVPASAGGAGPGTPAAPPRPGEQLALAKPEPSVPDTRTARPREQGAQPEIRPQPARTQAPKPEARPQPPVAEAPKLEARPQPPRPVPPAPRDKAGNAEHTEVASVVDNWARAWSSQDVKAYLAHYASDFETPGRQPRKAWEEERRARIVGKGRIMVKIETPRISVNGNIATVRFRQIYISDRLNAVTRKTLVLAKQGGRWKIKQENTGS